jgi:integrase
MPASGLRLRPVQYTHAVYRKALRDAERWDGIRKNVAAFARPPKQDTTERPVTSYEEADAFLCEIRGDRLEALYLLAFTTGLRRGELLGIHREDLDLDKDALRV